jgi:O-antigen biosynthesis protein
VRSPRRFVQKTREHLSAVAADLEAQQGRPFADALPVSGDLPNVVYPNIDLVSGPQPRLNVLIPGMQMKHMSGGPNTAVNLTYRLASTGVPVRYVSTDLEPEADRALLQRHFASLTGIASLGNVELDSVHDRSKRYRLADTDVFFATAWWTAQYVARLVSQSRTDSFVYLIQDYEPGFYNWSSQYALALQTYGMDYRAVICGRLLAEYLDESKVGRFADPAFIDSCAVFEPAIDRTRFRADREAMERTPRRLLFYARPDAPRNLFEIGLAALKGLVERGALAPDRWELWFIGSNVQARDLGGGFVIRQHPWLDYDSYAGLLRSSDVGLSLMMSPHTSYPPLEMAACGASVVTNTFANKDATRLTLYSENIIPVAATVDSVTDGLVEAVARVGDYEARLGASCVDAPTTWEVAFDPVLPKLVTMWNECRARE